MRILILALLVALSACTQKEKPALPTPAVPTPLKEPYGYKNDCEKIFDASFAEIKDMKLNRAVMASPAPNLICHVTFNSDVKIQESLYYVEDGKPKLIASTGAVEQGECGGKTVVFKTEVIELRVKPTEKKTVLAIETVTSTDPCCGSAKMESSKVQLFDIATHVLTAPFMGSNFCIDDKQCTGGFCQPGKGLKTAGVRYRFDWIPCTKGDICDQISFDKADVATNNKPLEFILKWDGGTKLEEAAY